MDFETVTSRKNALVKTVRSLASSSKERKEAGLFVLEGLRLCLDAAENGCSIETVVVSDDFKQTDKSVRIINSAKRRISVSDDIFRDMCDTVSPQGILCIVKFPDTARLAADIKSGRYIVLENTADPANLGAIARTAEALGIDGLIVSSCGCDPFSPKSLRAAMGALLRIPVIVSGDIYADLELLKSKRFSVFATVINDADCDVREVVYPENCAVLIGNEANGLTEKAVSVCNRKLTITMSGRAESLNAAAAASIVMWEMVR